MLRPILYAILLLAGSTAAADSTVAVLDVTARPVAEWREIDRDMVSRMGEALVRGSGFSVLSAEEKAAFFAEPPDPQARGLAEQALKKLEAGRGFSTRLKPGRAIEEFTSALRTLRAIFPHLPDLSDLAEAHLQRGMTYQALGKDSWAGQEYLTVLLLDPDRKLDDAVVNPVVIERFEQVRAELVTSMKGSVSLLSKPAGARVLMNGRLVGWTPITVPGVLPGEHYFSMHRPGYRTWFGVIYVPAGRIEMQEVFLAEGRSIARVRLLQRIDQASAAGQLADGLGAGWLVLMSFTHPGGQHLVKLSVFERGGPVATLGIFPVDGDRIEALADKVRRWMAGDRSPFAGPKIVRKSDPVVPDPALPPPPDGSSAWYEQWWFWTVVGAVVVGAATTTTVLLLQQDSGILVVGYR